MMKEVGSGQAVCPRCGTLFEPTKVYTVADIAHNLGVAKSTVGSWMFTGQLVFRLWARSSRSIRRVVLGADMMRFMEQRFPLPDPDGEHLAQRLWNRTISNGRKGQAASRIARQRKLDEQALTIIDPTPTPKEP